MMPNSNTTIIVAGDANEYRATISRCIKDEDIVLEIGCAEGTTTVKLAEHCSDVVGIDKGGSLPKARSRYPWVRFEQIDGFDIPGIKALGKQFTKIYIDISGNRDVSTVIPLIQKHEAVFKPELIVVKNSKLKKLLRKCSIWEDVEAGYASN